MYKMELESTTEEAGSSLDYLKRICWQEKLAEVEIMIILSERLR